MTTLDSPLPILDMPYFEVSAIQASSLTLTLSGDAKQT